VKEQSRERSPAIARIEKHGDLSLRSTKYVVRRVLKETKRGRTELVHAAAAPATTLVRKSVACPSRESARNLKIRLEALQGLEHPGLLRLREVDEPASGTVVYVREYAPGVPILEACAGEKGFLAALIRLVDLIACLHASGLGEFLFPPTRIFFEEAAASRQATVRCFPHERNIPGCLPARHRRFLSPESVDVGFADLRAELYPVGRLIEEWRRKRKRPGAPEKAGLFQRLGEVEGRLLSLQPPRRYSSAGEALADLLLLAGGDGAPAVRRHASRKIPFVRMEGRQAVLEKLTVHAERSLEAEKHRRQRIVHLVLLSGAPGIGKSRLLRELALRLRSPSRLIGFGTCNRLEKPVYQPFREILHEFFFRVRIPSSLVHPFSRALKKLVPDLIRAEAFAPWAELKSEDEKLRLIEGIARFFLKLSGMKRLVLMLEDLHYIDDASLELLKYLLRNIYILAQNQERPGIFICGTYEPQEKGGRLPLLKMLEELGEEALHAEVHLHPLAEGERLRLINGVADSCGLPPAKAQELGRLSFDEPLLYEQAAHLLREDRRLFTAALPDAGGGLRGFDGFHGFHSVLRALVLRRRALLRRSESQVVDAMAILGRPATLALLQVCRGSRRGNLYRIVQGLQWRGWVRAVRTGGEQRFFLSHDAVGKVIVEEFSAEERRLLHRKAGVSLETFYTHEPMVFTVFVEELAYHFFQAGHPGKGIRYGLMAGNELQALYANSKALEIFKAVSRFLKGRKAGKTRVDVLGKIVQLNFLQGDYEGVVESAWEWMRTGGRSLPSREQAWYFRMMGEAYREKGEWDKAIDCFEKGLKVVGHSPGLGEAARLLGLKGHILVMKGDFQSARQACEEGIRLAEEAGRTPELAAAYNSFGSIHWMMGDLPSAIDHFQRSLEISQQLGRKQEAAITLNNLGLIFSEQSDVTKAIEYCRRSLLLKESIGDIRGIANSAINLTVYYFRKYDYDRVERYARKGLEIAGKIGYHRGVSFCLSNIAETQMWWGDYAGAVQNTKKSLKIAEKMGEMRRVCNFLRRLGQLYFYLGKIPEALDHAGRALDLAEELRHKESLASACEAKGEILASLSRTEEADRLFARAEQIARELQDKEVLGGVLITVAHWNFENGREAAARTEIEEAEGLVKKMNLKKDMARILYLKGRMLKSGAPRKALTFLRQALEICERIRFPEMSWRVDKEIAEIYRKIGNDVQARVFWEKAANELQQITNRLDEEEWKYAYLQHPERLAVMRSLRVYQ
jgi:tetratricopeptide (TPR) repeat protein